MEYKPSKSEWLKEKINNDERAWVFFAYFLALAVVVWFGIPFINSVLLHV